MIHGHGSHGTYRAVPVRLLCSARGLSRRLGEKPFSSEMDGIKPLEFMVNHPQMESKWKPKKMGWWLGLPRKKHVYHIWLWIIYVYMSIQARFLDLCGFVNAPRTWIFPGVNLMSIHSVNICRTTGTALPCTNEQRITGPQAKIAWSLVLEPGPHIFLHQLITCWDWNTATLVGKASS